MVNGGAVQDALSPTAGRVDEWGIDEAARADAPAITALVAFYVAPAVLLGVAAWIAIGPLAALVVTMVCLAIAAGVAAVASRRPLKGEASAGAGTSEAARVRNLAEGLAADLGMRAPALRLVSSGPANAFLSGDGTLVLTGGIERSLTRTELEAVIAHCLVRMRAGGLKWARLASAWGRLHRWGPRVGNSDDLMAARLTRYPTGLAAAIEKAQPARGRLAPLWFVAEGPSHRSPAERAAALRGL